MRMTAGRKAVSSPGCCTDMAVSVTGQALAFLGALALGAALGLLYDIFRVLRVRLPWKLLGAVLDLLFWLAVTAALFVYSVAAGDGEVRVYLTAVSYTHLTLPTT